VERALLPVAFAVALVLFLRAAADFGVKIKRVEQAIGLHQKLNIELGFSP
jgi:hypothetical protein